MQKISYHDIIEHTRFRKHYVSYHELTATPEAAYQKMEVSPLDTYRLVTPYLRQKSGEQLKAVLPLALYLGLFQLLILRQPIADVGIIVAGLTAVIIGLMFFMEGLRLGLMPFGEIIGNRLPQKSSLKLVLLITFLLGIGVTFAEPAIGALKAAGSNLNPQSAPYLYLMLTEWSGALVLVVGIGVGLAAIVGTLRFVYEWSLKPIIYLTLIPTLLLTAYSATNHDLSTLIGLAWDCGAVTTGPVTVPLVLALGIGIAAATGSGQNALSGFGIVTLASLFPVLAVQLLSLYLYQTQSVEHLLHVTTQIASTPVLPWYEQSPVFEIIMGVRAIVPLILFLAFILVFILKERLPQRQIIMAGLVFSIVGMIIFNLGLAYGLSTLGNQSGTTLPSAFIHLTHIDGSPFYWYALGIFIAIVFSFILGFGATLAEPALNALGATVQSLTHGVFRKRTLMIAVSIGVGMGIAIGVSKIIFELPLAWLLIPSYLFAAVLTYFSTESYVNVAWDSAGVTTGPITVPLVLALGLGLSGAVDAIEGFGILSMASIGPIITVMLTGLWVEYRQKRYA
jgi:hypothetical protein